MGLYTTCTNLAPCNCQPAWVGLSTILYMATAVLLMVVIQSQAVTYFNCIHEFEPPYQYGAVITTAGIWVKAAVQVTGGYQMWMVLLKKWDKRCNVIEYKPMAQRFTQKLGTGFSDEYFWTCYGIWELTYLALLAVEGWHLCQMMSKGTYLNRKFMEELFMKQLIDFEDGTEQVHRLVKFIYGLRRAVFIALTLSS